MIQHVLFKDKDFETVMAYFGKGNIALSTGIATDNETQEQSVWLCCKNCTEPQEIGSAVKGLSNDVTEVKPELILSFTKVESIDIVIDMLQHARQDLVAIIDKKEPPCH